MENPTTWTGAYRAAIATAFKDFAEAVSADEANKGVNANLGILHRTRNGAPLSAPTLGAIVTITCDSRIDSQRRRLGRDRA